MKYVYPAIFEKEDDMYNVFFPDLEGCYTSGENLEDALANAEDALALMLFHYETKNKNVPKPSEITKVKVPQGDFVSLIKCDTLEYGKKHSKKTVKKTLTIPEYLDKAGTEAGVNFSKVLQDGLIKILGLG